MPVNDRYPMEDVLAACRDYADKWNRDVFIEYVMLGGVNDQVWHASPARTPLDPKRFKVNLIPYNPTGSIYDASSRPAIQAFRETVESYGLRTTVRVNRGATSMAPAASWPRRLSATPADARVDASASPARRGAPGRGGRRTVARSMPPTSATASRPNATIAAINATATTRRTTCATSMVRP